MGIVLCFKIERFMINYRLEILLFQRSDLEVYIINHQFKKKNSPILGLFTSQDQTYFQEKYLACDITTVIFLSSSFKFTVY